MLRRPEKELHLKTVKLLEVGLEVFFWKAEQEPTCSLLHAQLQVRIRGFAPCEANILAEKEGGRNV